MKHDNGDRFHIMFVEPGKLPTGQDFAFLECGGEVWLAYDEGRITPAVLEASWTAFRDMVKCEVLSVA